MAQKLRLGAGELITVDNDRMEERNVNRIPNSTMQDVRDNRLKVDVLADAIERADLGTRVLRIPARRTCGTLTSSAKSRSATSSSAVWIPSMAAFS